MKLRICNLLGLSIGLTLMSCTQIDESVYSCNEDVDSWVKENVAEIRLMSRSNWLETSDGVSRAIYRAFTPEQRVSFWREKIQESKQLPWNDEELRHIEKIESFMESHLFIFGEEPLTEAQEDEIDLFFYKWKTEAVNNLNWTDKVVFALVASGNKVINTDGDIEPLKPSRRGMMLSDPSESTTTPDRKEDCECSYVSSFCDCEVTGRCNVDSNGCGLFWAFPCDGMCKD